MFLALRLIAIADDASAYVLGLAQARVEAVLVSAQPGLSGYEHARERVLTFSVQILGRVISNLHVTA